jgi:hypothetical protein
MVDPGSRSGGGSGVEECGGHGSIVERIDVRIKRKHGSVDNF